MEETQSAAVRERLSLLPDQPGVYMFKNKAGDVIYVGKATSLRSRVRSYFQQAQHLPPKIRTMRRHIADLEYIVTDTEVEALILEATLVKQKKPWYNVRLKDDKAFPYIKVTVNEPYPRVMVVRRTARDGARYFGPYTNVRGMRQTLKFLRKLFPLRTCNLDLSGELNYRPCLLYHIDRCVAPCAGKCTPEAYDDLIEQVCLFLEGRHEQLLPALRRKMEAAAERLEFERAARLRDQLRALESVVEQQKMVSQRRGDEDVIGFAVEGDLACVQVFFVREGKLVGRDHFLMELGEGFDDSTGAEILQAFMTQYYGDAAFIPRDVLLQEEVEDPEVIEAWLREKRRGAVRLHVPKRGEKRRLVEMVTANAALVLQEHIARRQREDEDVERALRELQEALELPAQPERMEAFDISNIHGSQAVASMVVFERGKPKTDDYAMIQEAVRRRFLRALREQDDPDEAETSFSIMPDLVVIDGGKGQLNAARQVMRELGMEEVPAVALAERFEHVYVEGRSEPVILPRESPGLRLLQRLRDEAHRFALTYHRKLRDARTSRSALDDIPGIGPRRKKALLQHFGSVRRIAEASLEELQSVPGIPRDVALRIHESLRTPQPTL